MKKYLFAAIAVLFFLPISVDAATPKNLYGRIVLEVERHGEAWYIHPQTGVLYFLGRPSDALALMRTQGLGITNENLFRIARPEDAQNDVAFAKSLAGRILLQVEDRGEAWYVHPVSLQRFYLGRPSDALSLLRTQGLGISKATMATLTISPEYKAAQAVLARAKQLVAAEPKPVVNIGESVVEGMTRTAKGDAVVYRFVLNSPVSSDEYGYLTAGTYYLGNITGLMNGDQYLQSQEYLAVIDKAAVSQQILGQIIQIQTGLEWFYSDIGGYPVSETVVDLPGGKETFFSKEHGFFGTAADKTVYFRVHPFAAFGYTYSSLDEGASYVLTFTLPATVGGFESGQYILTPLGITKQ